jgi:hypothetical protein
MLEAGPKERVAEPDVGRMVPPKLEPRYPWG